MKNIVSLAITSILVTSLMGVPVSAHRSGCHRWHSCPSDSGSYSCGDTGYYNYCAESQNLITPPTLSVKREITYRVIPMTKKVIEDSNEYIGYEKISTEGKNGRAEVTTNIHLADGVESFRESPTESIIEKPVSEVRTVGTRKKPTGYIDYIWKSNDPGFWKFMFTEYDVAAAATPLSKVALLKNGKVVDLGESDATGSIFFRNIRITNDDRLSLGTYSGRKILWTMPKATQISEPSRVDTRKLTVVSEYDSFHKQESTRTIEKGERVKCGNERIKKYFEQRSKTDELLDGHQESVTIYYPDVCVINLDKKSSE